VRDEKYKKKRGKPNNIIMTYMYVLGFSCMIGLIILSFDLTHVLNYTIKNVYDINTER